MFSPVSLEHSSPLQPAYEVTVHRLLSELHLLINKFILDCVIDIFFCFLYSINNFFVLYPVFYQYIKQHTYTDLRDSVGLLHFEHSPHRSARL